jgi:hypothetical protein
MQISAGYFLKKHLFTISQKERLLSLSRELDKENLDLEEIRNISKTFIDRGSRKTRIDTKFVRNNLVLWALLYPLAIVQTGIKSLDYTSLIRYKSPLKTKKLGLDDNNEVLGIILKTLDKIITLGKNSDEPKKILTLEGLKHDLIHEIRPLFLKEKYTEKALKIINQLIQNLKLNNSNEISEIISFITHPNKESFEDILKSFSVFKRSINICDRYFKEDNKNHIADHLQNLDKLFGNLELFITQDISTKALLLNGSSHLFFYYLLGIPGPKLSALTTKEIATKKTKKLDENQIKEITKESLKILDLLYTLHEKISKQKNTNDQFSYKIKNLIAKIELNIYPLKNIIPEYEKFLVKEIEKSEIYQKERLRELISINNPQTLVDHINSKGPDLFSQIFVTGMIFNNNDNSEELMRNFDDKILKNEKGEFIIEPKILDQFKKNYYKTTPDLIKNLVLLTFLVNTSRNKQFTRREFLGKTMMGVLNYNAAYQFIKYINLLPDEIFNLVKNTLTKGLLTELKINKISEEKQQQILRNFESDNEISKSLLSFLILNSGFPVMFGAYGFDEPDYVRKNSNKINEKIEVFIEILKNIIEIKPKKT